MHFSDDIAEAVIIVCWPGVLGVHSLSCVYWWLDCVVLPIIVATLRGWLVVEVVVVLVIATPSILARATRILSVSPKPLLHEAAVRIGWAIIKSVACCVEVELIVCEISSGSFPSFFKVRCSVDWASWVNGEQSVINDVMVFVVEAIEELLVPLFF